MSQPAQKVTDYESLHQAWIQYYESQVEQLFDKLVSEAVRLALTLPTSPDHVFSFADFPAAAGRFSSLMAKLHDDIVLLVGSGMAKAWSLSGLKNDALAGDVMSMLSESQITSIFGARNEGARLAFAGRSINGLNLSDRVWNYTGAFGKEIELGLDAAILSGTPARKLATQLKQNLREPNRLFRRVRNARGNLVLSQNAKTFKPGLGVYRSSYANALRLTRTEINGSYRQADLDRWATLPFVTGYSVRRSLNRVPCILCDSMVGNFPKTFVFQGWHPACRCIATPILATPDEVNRLTAQLIAGESVEGFTSINQVSRVNPGFTKWVRDNRQRWEQQNGSGRPGATPLFIQQNGGFVAPLSAH
ncbi:MAG: hypothetical protein JWP57_2056 [Spirosoma sp.]|nr:hypothetical protein [Spirosoma sp.]